MAIERGSGRDGRGVSASPSINIDTDRNRSEYHDNPTPSIRQGIRFNLDQQIADLVEDARVCSLDQIELVRAKLRLADTLLGRVVDERGSR